MAQVKKQRGEPVKELRERGWTFGQIALELKIPKSTVFELYRA